VFYDSRVDPKDLLVLERALDTSPVNSTAVTGGFSGSRCWSVELADGQRVFVKVADDDESVAGHRNEAIVLDSVRSRHLPSFIGIFDDGRLLVIEDLGTADWSPLPLRIDELWDAIGDVGTHAGPPSLWQSFQGSGRDTWAAVVSDDRFGSAVGLEPGWMERYESILTAASQQADTSGDQLVHGDLAPGNWCRDAAGTWRFVDWASAYRGNPAVDEVIASVRLTRLTGSPRSSTNVGEHPELAAFIAGRFASELLDVDWTGAPLHARSHRIADIQSGLSLTAHLMGLPPPSFR
jgi:hypothetical protein